MTTIRESDVVTKGVQPAPHATVATAPPRTPNPPLAAAPAVTPLPPTKPAAPAVVTSNHHRLLIGSEHARGRQGAQPAPLFIL